MAFSSVAGLLEAARDKPLWRAVLEDDLRDRGADEARSWHQMAALWAAMKAPVAEYDPAARSRSGLTGGAGALLDGPGPGLCPPFLRQVIAAALKTGECNACMRRIVAAPTAGASGVLPAVLIPLQARDGLSDETMIQALYVSAGFGQVIATRASIPARRGAVRRRWAPPPAWRPPPWCLSWAARRNRWPTPAPWPCPTPWAWCAIRWPGWWRCPASTAT